MDPKLWKIWSKASANKSQIIWFLIYKDKASIPYSFQLDVMLEALSFFILKSPFNEWDHVYMIQFDRELYN